MKCEICGERDAVAQQCPGDFSDHRHGMIHVDRENKLKAACLPCGEKQGAIWGRTRGPSGRWERP